MIADYDQFHLFYGLIVFTAVNLLFLINFLRTELFRILAALLIVVIVSFFLGFRQDNIGIDSAQYSDIFMGLIDREGIEPVFLVLRYLLRPISSTYSIFFIVSSLMINVLILYSFKQITRNYPLAMALFLSTFLFLNMNINVMRQALAISIAFYALSSLINQKLYRFWLFLLVAISTHYTAAVFIPIYFIRNCRITKRVGILFIFLALTLFSVKASEFFVYIKDVNDYFNRIYYYFKWNGGVEWHIKHIYYMVLVLVTVYFSANQTISIKYQNIFNYYLYGILLVLFFREEEMVADRIFYYFILIGIVLIINLKSIVRNKLLFYLPLWIGMNLWFLKTVIIQLPSWFIPPYTTIRHM